MKRTTRESNSVSRGWFLETSVPRKLLFGHSLLKEEILKHLRGTDRWSSYYVLMEFKRSVVKTLIDLYFVVLEENNPGDALLYFSEGFMIRQNKIILSAIGEWLKESDIANDKKRFLLKLETLIVETFQYLDDIIIGYVENRTHCQLAKAAIKEEATKKESYERFSKEIDCRTQCSIEKFWQYNKSQLKRLVKEGEKDSHTGNKGFQKTLSLVKSVIGNVGLLKAKRNCMSVGDVIIALEMPKDLRMLTFDKAFDSICGILGKEVTVLPSLMAVKKSIASMTPPS
jgi:hypothetical protein